MLNFVKQHLNKIHPVRQHLPKLHFFNTIKTRKYKGIAKLRPAMLCLTMVLLTTSCSCQQYDHNADKAFTALCDEIFVDMVQSDAITLNYTLSNPKAFGITNSTHTLGRYSEDAILSGCSYYENKLQLLQNISYPSLNDDNKLTYDTLFGVLDAYLDMAPYTLYTEPLSPVTGIHANLPVLLSEYHFYNVVSISEYFCILKNVPDYFNQIIEFEKKKKANGLFMGTTTAKKIIAQCHEFIKEPENNLLIQVFADNITPLNLSTSDKESYIKENEFLIKENIIPAYQNIIDSLSSLIGSENKPCTPLCNFPKGKEYYTTLVRMETGSSLSIPKMKLLLEKSLTDCHESVAAILKDNPNIINELSNTTLYSKKPAEIIEYLKNNILNKYPPLPKSTGNLNIKYVHPSLENTLSPAMYITPPIDCTTSDNIYINRACLNDSSMFTTLAHEGYPGHLYQTNYFMLTNPHPIRLLLSFPGYSEGFATYAELYSYSIAGIDTTRATVLRNNKLTALCIYSLIDIGIHHYGWSYGDCANFLKKNGITDKAITHEIYFTIIEEPSLYLKYTIGCLEFITLENNYKDTLGTSYDPVEFHKLILETGPTGFEILSDKVNP